MWFWLRIISLNFRLWSSDNLGWLVLRLRLRLRLGLRSRLWLRSDLWLRLSSVGIDGV